MKQKFTYALALFAASLFITTAEAGHKRHSTDFFDQLVRAALPKDRTVEGMLNSGTLGVTIFLVCEAEKGLEGRKARNRKCVK